jgi:t-SNARE complex subunit (syntaxin)
MAKKVAKKAAPKKGNKFSQMMLAAETVQKMDGILKDVKDSKSSVFSKDDVIKIISEIKGTFNQESPTVLIDMEEFIDEVAENIVDNITEMDLDDFDLSLDGTTICIDRIKLDSDSVRGLVEEITSSYFA